MADNPVPADVFLSYNHQDHAAAEALLEQLQDAGFTVFKDNHALREGARWLSEIEQALERCGIFIVLVGAAGIDGWVRSEVNAAITRHNSTRNAATGLPRIFPFLYGGASDAMLGLFLQGFQAVRWDAADGLRPDTLAALGVPALRTHGDQAAAAAAASLPAGSVCPYQGLATFGPEQAGLYFGRSKEINDVIRALGDQARRGEVAERAVVGARGYSRWVDVEGHSGSGKSSLIFAGVLPRVAAGELERLTGLAQWQLIGPMRPGRTPLLTLCTAVELALAGPAGTRDGAALADRMRGDETALAQVIRDGPQPGSGHLLVIDQFEELYTLSDIDPAERACLDAQLAYALGDAQCPFFLITTVRSDLMDHIYQLPRLAALYNDHCSRYMMPMMSAAGLRQIIEEPARLAGLDVGDVSAALLRDADGEPGALPLVANALQVLWEEAARRHGLPVRQLEGYDYTARGGLVGMLAHSGDELLQTLQRQHGKAGETAALELLLCLTQYSPDGRHTRKSADVGEALLAAGNGNEALGRDVLRVLAGQADANRPGAAGAGQTFRVVTTGVSGQGRSSVDLIHETLLRTRPPDKQGRREPYWPRLADYIDKHSDRTLLRDQLALSVKQWKGLSGLARWRGLADASQSRAFQRLRLVPGSIEHHYLRLSRRKVWVTRLAWGLGTPLAALPLLWSLAQDLPLQTVARPLWWLGLPAAPATVALPAPAGRSTMGCLPGRDTEAGADCGSQPAAREVTLDKVCEMGRDEVSNVEFYRFAWAQGLAREADAEPVPLAARHQPVVNVSYAMARAYAQWLSAQSSRWTYRLPTEDEWEYAARGRSTGAYPWGRAVGDASRANLRMDPAAEGGGLLPVGRYPANDFGLHDVIGNAWEWVDSGQTDPQDSAMQVARGGSYQSSATRARITARNTVPGFAFADIGFRVCRDARKPPATP